MSKRASYSPPIFAITTCRNRDLLRRKNTELLVRRGSWHHEQSAQVEQVEQVGEASNWCFDRGRHRIGCITRFRRLARSSTGSRPAGFKGRLESLDRVLAQAGFARKYAWGCGPHRFYFGYRENEGTWLKLDIVTDLCYGTPVRWLKIDSNEFLQNRIRDEQSLALRPDRRVYNAAASLPSRQRTFQGRPQ